MSLAFTPDTLRAAYEYLDTTQPFIKWNMPDADDVCFRVVRSPALRGWYRWDGNRHVIAVSCRCVGSTALLMQTVAHEMIHLHEENARTCTAGEHSAAFNRWAAQVCKVHGWDRLGF